MTFLFAFFPESHRHYVGSLRIDRGGFRIVLVEVRVCHQTQLEADDN